MHFNFEKYQGTGNDFVMIDHRNGGLESLTQQQISQICHRRFGIGADGFILIENDPDLDFKMVYYNSDGRQSTMCGNGGRCSVKFARSLGIGSDERIDFMAIDGKHTGSIQDGVVSLSMQNVTKVEPVGNDVFIDTGSPHHVQVVSNLEEFKVDSEGRRIREEVYHTEGSNVNFIEFKNGILHVRTYERGVEAETYSCGTGVTASALALYNLGMTEDKQIQIDTPGGELQVSFEEKEGQYSNIQLMGPAERVFEGTWKVE